MVVVYSIEKVMQNYIAFCLPTNIYYACTVETIYMESNVPS